MRCVVVRVAGVCAADRENAGRRVRVYSQGDEAGRAGCISRESRQGRGRAHEQRKK